MDKIIILSFRNNLIWFQFLSEGCIVWSLVQLHYVRKENNSPSLSTTTKVKSNPNEGRETSTNIWSSNHLHHHLHALKVSPRKNQPVVYYCSIKKKCRGFDSSIVFVFRMHLLKISNHLCIPLPKIYQQINTQSIVY